MCKKGKFEALSSEPPPTCHTLKKTLKHVGVSHAWIKAFFHAFIQAWLLFEVCVNKSLNVTVLVSVNLKVCINLTDIATVVPDFAFKYYH